MKQLIFFIVFLFLLCILSIAFNPQPTLDLTQVYDHHHNHHDHHQIKPSYSSNIILPTDSSPVLDHIRSYPIMYEEPHNIHINRYPVYRYSPLRCHQLIRFKGQPLQFEGGFGPVQQTDVRVSEAYAIQHRNVPQVESSSVRVFDEFSGPRERGPLHYNDHDNAASLVEVKEEYHGDKKDREDEVEKNLQEKNNKHEDEENENNDVVKMFRKFLA